MQENLLHLLPCGREYVPVIGPPRLVQHGLNPLWCISCPPTNSLPEYLPWKLVHRRRKGLKRLVPNWRYRLVDNWMVGTELQRVQL